MIGVRSQSYLIFLFLSARGLHQVCLVLRQHRLASFPVGHDSVVSASPTDLMRWVVLPFIAFGLTGQFMMLQS